MQSILLVAVVVALAGLGGLFSYYYLSSQTVRDTVGTLVTRAHTPDNAFPGKDSVTILLMGRDLDRDERGRVVETRGRTDAMMLVRFDFRSRSADILSIPRDTLVRIPGYRGKHRISYANAYGGPDLAIETVSEFLGVQPDGYALMNFDGFEKAIDSMGGLWLAVDKKLDYDDNWGNLHIHLEPGEQLLNGEQCMGFVRYRQSNDGDCESDLVRIQRQQALLKSARDRLGSPSAMFRLPEVLDIVREDLEADLSPSQLICLANFVRGLSSDSGINMVTLPALDDSGVYVRADPDATRELMDRLFLNKERWH